MINELPTGSFGKYDRDKAMSNYLQVIKDAGKKLTPLPTMMEAFTQEVFTELHSKKTHLINEALKYKQLPDGDLIHLNIICKFHGFKYESYYYEDERLSIFLIGFINNEPKFHTDISHENNSVTLTKDFHYTENETVFNYLIKTKQ